MTRPGQAGKRIFFVDVIRVVGTFGVVWLHATAPVLYQFDTLPLFSWWLGNLFDSMVRMCVPLFFMISGYLLLDKTEHWLVFLRKRTVRVVIPLLAWSVFYLLFDLLRSENRADPAAYLLGEAGRVLSVPVFYHLWFLYALVGLYLLMPVLRVYVQAASTELKCYLLIIWLATILFIPSISRTGFTLEVGYKMIYGFSGYLILGNLLGSLDVSPQMARGAVLAFAMAVAVTAWGTYCLTFRDGAFNQYFYGYLAPNVLIMACAAFIALKYWAERSMVLASGFTGMVIARVSAASFGIYLIHPAVLMILASDYISLDLGFDTGSMLMVVFARWALAMLVSLLSVYALWLVPLGRKIVPS